jgi:hypothetical protein
VGEDSRDEYANIIAWYAKGGVNQRLMQIAE